ncbi:MAG: hypothetical protein ACE5HN_00940 [Nitrospiria bacterium]
MTWLGKTTRSILSIIFLLLMIGCTNPEGKSRELYETAQFEEQQTNFKHAKQLYEEIIREYPNTSFAVKARARLKEIEEE